MNELLSEMLKNSGVKQSLDIINEMAKPDAEGINFKTENLNWIAGKYIENYKKRTGKKFTAQALSAFKILLGKMEKAGDVNSEDIPKLIEYTKNRADLPSKKEKLDPVVKSARKAQADKDKGTDSNSRINKGDEFDTKKLQKKLGLKESILANSGMVLRG